MGEFQNMSIPCSLLIDGIASKCILGKKYRKKTLKSWAVLHTYVFEQIEQLTSEINDLNKLATLCIHEYN